MKSRETSRTIRHALNEDKAGSDITSRLLFGPRQKLKAAIVTKENGIVCGLEVAARVFRAMDPACRMKMLARDGDRVRRLQKVMRVEGNAVKILAAERTAVNFLQHLSGIATQTARFIAAVRGRKVKILDTRKTIPGLRSLQKYAVRMGGGSNHRMNLGQAAMVKDNHLKVLGKNGTRLLQFKKKLPHGVWLIVEAKTLAEIKLAMAARADVILLDNMGLPKLRTAVGFIRAHNPSTQIEVSGGVTLKNIGAIAKLGVERISIGALTHSAPALDFSLEALS